MQKIIFMDIDGTLVGFDGKIPDSTIEALKIAKQKGHQLVICSGRSRFQIDRQLVRYGFDGIVGASGAFLDIHEKEIYHYYMEEEKRKFLTDFLDENKITYSMQGEAGTRMNRHSAARLLQRYHKVKLSKERIDRFIGGTVIGKNTWEDPKLEKAVYYDSPFTVEEMQKHLSPFFDVVGASFEKPDPTAGEIGIAGISKATGMERYLKEVQAKREQSIAFGDSHNDIEMLQYAAVGVAMGNGQTMAKAAADYVTDAIDQDGIYHAFEKLNII